MLAGLRHRTVDRADDENRAVHLRRAGDHVLDVVGVARAVDVRVMTVGRRVLDVAGGDRENLRLVAPALRLGRLGDLVVRHELRPALVGRDLGERSRQRGLAVVDVPDGADVHVRFAAIEFFFGHVVFVLGCLYVARRSRLPCSPSPLPRSRSTCRARTAGYDSLGWLATRSSRSERRLEPMTRIELVTSSLPRTRSAN